MEVFNNIVPQEHESALKQALYNTLAFVFVLVFACAALALYFILEPFLSPLLWALLFGSVLYPFKRSLSQGLREWLRGQQAPLAVAVATAPLTALDNVAQSFISLIRKYLKLLAAIALIILVAYFLPLSWFLRVLTLVKYFYLMTTYFLGALSSGYAVWAMIVGYTMCLLFNFTDGFKPYLAKMCPIVYLSFFCYITNLFGAFKIPIILAFVALIIVGFIADIEERSTCGPKTCEKGIHAKKVYTEMSIVEITIVRKMKLWYIRLLDSIKGQENLPERDEDFMIDRPPPPLICVEEFDKTDSGESTDEQESTSHESDMYLIAVVWACVVVQLYRNLWFLPLVYIPLLYGMLKSLVCKLNLSEMNMGLSDKLTTWYDSRRDAISPGFVRAVVHLIAKGDSKIKHVLESSVDSITSIVVIVLLFCVATVGTIFMAVQVYGESVHLIEVTSGIINRTVVHNPELQQLVPDTISNVQGALDSMLGDAYQYGKEWIRGSLRRLLDDKDPVKAEVLETQIMDLWDRVYHLWIMQKNQTEVGEQKVLTGPSWNMLLDGLKTLDMSVITEFVKDNLGTMQTVIDSVWVILKGNVTIFFSVITAILSVVFGGGTAVLNFLINFIIFTTALFYLLAASDSTYKPIQLLSKAIPNSKGKPISGLGKAVEQAINGVFALSFKMAFFYGMYTWLIHSLFNVNIIYIPSVLAAIFGAVPFLGTYWACLPACLELWLVNGNPVRALLMMAAQIAPMCCVDTAIYSEIKGGGHPYLTGLAIAGGVFCMGVQGALFGPMLLCVLIAACNVYTKLVQKSNQQSLEAEFQSSKRIKKRASFSGQLVTGER